MVKTHDLVSVVASVDGPVVEVTTRQVNVAVRRVRQLGTFLKERKKGANIFKLFQVAICQKQGKKGLQNNSGPMLLFSKLLLLLLARDQSG